MFSFLLNPLAIMMSLGTVTGVFVHDTHMDAALSLSPMSSVVDDSGSKPHLLTGAQHTHTDRGSLSQVWNSIKGNNHQIQPRSTDERKHLLQKHVGRGHHAFDNYNLPLV